MRNQTEVDKSHVGMSDCFLCGECKELLLDKRMRNSLPRRGVYDKEPCSKCKEHMALGIIIISVRDGESGENPYRTGGWWVVKEEAVRKIINQPELLTQVLKSRVCFMPDEVCKLVGLEKAKTKTEQGGN